ncbi:MAG: aminotransferase class IV [Candidatus Caenarcaniphilales bacterium]|nr:aminotransferase class IV [Candidatus Caenarcaniphilales bacterium]
MAQVYFKDKFIEETEAKVSIADRSFRFGDGVFETLLIHNKNIFDFNTHYQRLSDGLKAYYIDIDVSNLEKLCKELINLNQLVTGYIRIIISRGKNGPGSIGYLPKNCKPYMIIQSFEKELPKFSILKLWLSPYRSHQSLSSKVNSSANYVLSMLEADHNSCHNALILDTKGNICETGSGNIYWFKDSKLYTPEPGLAFVPGTVQKKILKLFDGEIVQGKFKLEDIKSAEEVFMSNIGTLIAGVESISSQEELIYENPSNNFSKMLKLREKLMSLLS